jgi:NitT/TauT family transport system substrate-binding protein
VVLARQGIPTNVLRVDAITPLPGPGLVVGTTTLNAKRDALRGFVAATLRAMAEITADPQKGLDATFAVAPDLATDPAGQRAVLDATIAIWSSDYTKANGLGAINTDAWVASVAFMKSLPGSGVTRDLPVTELITTDLLSAR